jgi:hypothetical protein
VPNDRLVSKIERYRKETWRWQRRMAKPLTPTVRSERGLRDRSYRRWVLGVWKARAERARRTAHRQLARRMLRYRAETWRWQRVMGHGPAWSARRKLRAPTPEHAWRAASTWRKRAANARRKALNPPRKAAWLCIHRFEGRWDDPHPPYYGGLQMDWAFMRRYGRHLLRHKGTADNWTPLEQIWVAERAYRSGRGFYPWPNTARFCGLI